MQAIQREIASLTADGWLQMRTRKQGMPQSGCESKSPGSSALPPRCRWHGRTRHSSSAWPPAAGPSAAPAAPSAHAAVCMIRDWPAMPARFCRLPDAGMQAAQDPNKEWQHGRVHACQIRSTDQISMSDHALRVVGGRQCHDVGGFIKVSICSRMFACVRAASACWPVLEFAVAELCKGANQAVAACGEGPVAWPYADNSYMSWSTHHCWSGPTPSLAIRSMCTSCISASSDRRRSRDCSSRVATSSSATFFESPSICC